MSTANTMRKLNLYTGGILLTLATAACAHAATPQYLGSRQITLACAPANETTITTAELWVSTDGGRSWSQVPDAWSDDQNLHYTAPADGEYDFFIILINDAGRSSPPPAPGTPPAAAAIVDTTPPLLQVHAAELVMTDETPTSALLQSTFIEENLADNTTRVFYRATGKPWIDGGPATFGANEFTWPLPDDLTAPAELQLKIVATDLAGNRAASEPVLLTIPQPPATTTDQPATLTDGGRDNSPAREPPTDAPIPNPLVPSNATNLQHLRSLAAQFLTQGEYALAAARFEDALNLDPQNADLLVDLGSALYRVGQYDDARERFHNATNVAPNHTGAIEGLALVAATQKRYPQARQYLQRLLNLKPESGTSWLRYGDVEHRLGNTPQALQAWQRVLSVAELDAELVQRAQRRLEYFGPDRNANTPEKTDDQWPKQKPPRNPQSSSSTATKSTRKTPS